jgi:hypothetical protein
MEDILNKTLGLLGIPAVWAGILTVAALVLGHLIKQRFDHSLQLNRQQIDHSFKTYLEQLKEVYTEQSFKRELYAQGIKEYSTKQAQALRQAYLIVFEPASSTTQLASTDLDEQLRTVAETVLQPLREHVGILDESTAAKVYEVHTKLLSFGGRTLDEVKREKQDFFKLTEITRQCVKADKIAYRLGLISRPLEGRRQ